MDAAERELLHSTVRVALAGATETAAADAVLADLGWLEMLRAEPRDAVDIVFRSLGSTNAAASALDDVVVSALGLEPRADLAVLLPRFATWQPPGTADGRDVSAVGVATARVATATDLLIACASEAEHSAVTIPLSAVEPRAVEGVDPDGGFRVVRVDRAAVGSSFGGCEWDFAVASGRIAVAHQVEGACRSMLDLARTHALERVQFGRAVGQFQAVRHRLADALVALEALDATLTAAMDDGGTTTAALAKATAGRTAQIVASHAQQVLAGIGFTTDHPFHRFLKRTMTLEGLFGSADEITLDLGRGLLAARRVPTLIEL
jgi:hypothetical protein